MSSVIRAGVIGLGTGYGHARAYHEHPDTHLAAICDMVPERTERVLDQYPADFVTDDYRELLRRDDVQVVSICTPDDQHEEQVIAALEAGKDVLCEKPMALNLEACTRMIAVADRTGRRLMVGQVCRFAPGFALAKRLVERGEIGELFFVESEYAHDYEHIGGWRKDPKLKREPFVGGACHAVDLVRWIAGEPAEVFAYSNHHMLPDWPVDDCTIAVYKFKSGAIGKVFCSIGCKRPYTMRSVFYGSMGTIVCDNTSSEIQLYTTSLPEAKGFIKLPVDLNSHNVRQEVDELIKAIQEGQPVATDGREGARTVAACLAAVESARTGKPVSVPADL